MNPAIFISLFAVFICLMAVLVAKNAGKKEGGK
jgi:hypothetical protein